VPPLALHQILNTSNQMIAQHSSLPGGTHVGVSTANTSFSSSSKKSSKELSITMQRREIVDRLIDSRKKSAEKRQQVNQPMIMQPMIFFGHQQQSQETTLDENAWQMVQELSRGIPKFVSTHSGI
jgi:hypothetical protein